MKTRRMSVVIWLGFGLGVGACKGNSPGATTGAVSPLDASPDGPSVSEGGCQPGSYVYYAAPGCGAEAHPRCDNASPDAICAAIVYYCACDGVTTTFGSCGGISNTPYLYAGACKSDSGSATRSYAGIFVPAGSMAVGREYHTATLLPDGKVLIAGGWVHGAGDDTAEVASAELYDPGTGTFTTTGSLNFAREGHTATLLANGLVLIAGGYNGAIPGTPQPTDSDAGLFSYTGTFPATAELYDPGTGSFTATGSLNAARGGHTATLLTNGTVLITGGNDSDLSLRRLASAELYDPGAGTFTATASMAVPRALHTATLLPNGMVLIAGGDNGELANAELFDPRFGTFTSTGGMANSRSNHTATLLPSGTVLVAGGVGSTSDFASAELYDPGTRRFVATGSMTETRTLHTATLLQNGMVLIAGGVYGAMGGWSASAELYE